MNREEILDMAMDILDNTDATLEEAMGVAMENQMRALKAEARKTGRWANVAKRTGLKDVGKLEAARRSATDANNYLNSRKYRVKSDGKYRIDLYNDLVNKYDGKSNGTLERRLETEIYGPLRRVEDASDRVDRVGNLAKSVTANNGRGTRYRPKASKESAIMDTALDFLDMYDVSLEEAIDMAYDYIG